MSRAGAPWAVVRLSPPTDQELRDALVTREPGYQVVHISCHGGPDGLMLEDNLGRERLMPTADLVDALRGEGPKSAVRLVVLNACETEELGHALVEQAGVDRVIATRQPIEDSEARVLSERLYRRLAAGDTAGRALEEARRAIHEQVSEGEISVVADPQERADNLVLIGDANIRLIPDGQPAMEPLFVLYPVPHNDLPTQETPAGFVGRAKELRTLARWFEKTGRRAFAISGVGGVGKTALAVNAALRYAYLFDAVAFASAKGKPNFGLPEVLQALNTVLDLRIEPHEADDLPGAIARRLNAHAVLLVLDNLESLSLERTAELESALRRLDPLYGSRILMTLRPRETDLLTNLTALSDRLNLPELDPASAMRMAWNKLESIWNSLRQQIPPLPQGDGLLPPPDSNKLDALSRQAALPRTVLRSDKAALYELSTLAFRHPALIEKAVGMLSSHNWVDTCRRLKTLQGQEVEQALENFIGQMLADLLKQEPACLDVLHAALVFTGGAEASRLRSVVLGQQVADSSDEAVRFGDRWLLPAVKANLIADDYDRRRYDLDVPVRAYLERQRPPDPATWVEYRYRHAEAHLAVVEDYDNALKDGRMTYNAPLEWSNVTAALEWLVEQAPDDDRAARLLVEYSRHWRNVLMNNYDPRRIQWLGVALAAAERAGSAWDQANVRQAIGDVQQFRKDMEAALESYETALKLYQAVGDRLGEANALASQGQVALLQDDQPEADRLLAQAVAIYRAIGDRYSVAAQIGNYGWALRRIGQHERARLYLQQAADLFLEMGAAWEEYAERHRRAAEEQDSSSDLDMDKVLNDFEPLLQAIATIVRGDEEHKAEIEALLPELEQQGWHLNTAVHTIWDGQRDVDLLTADLDEIDTQLVRRILELVDEGEEQKGEEV